MKVGSLFSGIGGFDLGFENQGYDISWCVEKEDKCREVLKKHFTKTNYLICNVYNFIKHISYEKNTAISTRNHFSYNLFSAFYDLLFEFSIII